MKRRDSLMKALDNLVAGKSAAFEDILWLSFGDEWTDVRQRLLDRDLIRYNTRDDDYYITARGRASLIHSHNQRNAEPKQTA